MSSQSKRQLQRIEKVYTVCTDYPDVGQRFNNIEEAYQDWEKKQCQIIFLFDEKVEGITSTTDNTMYKYKYKRNYENGILHRRFIPESKNNILHWNKIDSLVVKKIITINPKFSSAAPDDIFWIDRLLLLIEKMWQFLSQEEKKTFKNFDDQNLWYAAEVIQDVLTDAEFRERYCISSSKHSDEYEDIDYVIDDDEIQ